MSRWWQQEGHPATIEDLSARTKYVDILCPHAILVTNEFSASRCTGHENSVLEDHEIREFQIYQNQTCYTSAF